MRCLARRRRTALTSALLDRIDTLVLDASVAINLLGTAASRDILSVMPWNVVIEKRAHREIRRHPSDGRDHVSELQAWELDGCARVVSLQAEAREIFDDLTTGSLAETLDDGEAATIAYAVAGPERTVPVIDEKKATRIFHERWPSRRLLETAGLFQSLVDAGLISNRFASDLIYAALTNARMHVSHRLRPWVVDLIGSSRAAKCPRLGQSARSEPS